MLAERRTDTVILRAASLLLAAGLACGLASPPLFWMALSGAGAAGVAFTRRRFASPGCC
jgi:hypothetical protein